MNMRRSEVDAFLDWEQRFLESRAVRASLWILLVVCFLLFALIIAGRILGPAGTPLRSIPFGQAFAALILPSWIITLALNTRNAGKRSAPEKPSPCLVLLRILLNAMVLLFVAHQFMDVLGQVLEALQ